MANETILEKIHGAGIAVDTEVTAEGIYPVQGKGIYEALHGEGGAATTTTPGTVLMAANVAEAVGANPTAAEFKALLDALIAAGIMAAAEE